MSELYRGLHIKERIIPDEGRALREESTETEEINMSMNRNGHLLLEAAAKTRK